MLYPAQDREEDVINPVISKNAAIFNDEDEDSNEPSILQMAKLPERSTTPELVKQEPAETAEPEPGNYHLIDRLLGLVKYIVPSHNGSPRRQMLKIFSTDILCTMLRIDFPVLLMVNI